MNPFDLSASDLLIWGVVLHFIADWPLQNDWMANNKAKRRYRPLQPWVSMGGGKRARSYIDGPWWDRHPAALVHAGIHGALLALVFGWVAAPLALVHLLIDTRVPVVWWSRLMRQTQPQGLAVRARWTDDPQAQDVRAVLYDVGMEVRFWTDQVFHIACIAAAALAVTL